MAVLRTTNCRAHGHPEFEIAFDPALVPVENDVHSFLAWLEQSVAEGEHYLPGQTCQVGWAITEVRTQATIRFRCGNPTCNRCRSYGSRR